MRVVRTYELSQFDGERVPFKTLKERKAIEGKRIGYDLRGSCMSHFGLVTAAGGRGEIEIDGILISVNSIEQIAVLSEQPASIAKGEEK